MEKNWNEIAKAIIAYEKMLKTPSLDSKLKFSIENKITDLILENTSSLEELMELNELIQTMIEEEEF